MENFEYIVQQHAARYPDMQPQDFGKLAYQSEFGPAHLSQNVDELTASLLREWAALPADSTVHPPEPVGNGLCRLYLDPHADASLAAPLLARLMHRTMQEHHGTADGLRRRIAVLQTLQLPDMQAWLDHWEQEGFPPVHHSEACRAACRPHYRLLRADLAGYFPALLAAARLIQGGKPAVLAIDGRCGSGKSSLAQLLHELFGCNVLHMDDFYLPFDERAPDWTDRPAGNINLSRFRNEALAPAAAGQSILYRAYSCQQGRYRDTAPLSPTPLTVAEGSYSHHPALADAYQCKVFLTCPDAVQARRLQAREGSHYAAFVDRWIPMEELYFRACGVPSSDTMVIDTGDFF